MATPTHYIGVPLELPDIAATNVPTPASGHIHVFSEGGKLKQKDSGGTVTDLTVTGAGGSLADGDYTDIVVSWGGTVLVVKEPTLRKSETSVNNSPLFTAINKFDTAQTNFYVNGTVALNTTVEAEGTGCMEMTLSTAWVCGPRLTLASTTSFLRKSFSIKCRADAWADISTAEILFATEAGFTNFFLWQWKGSTNPKLVSPTNYNGEFIERVFNPGDCAIWSGTPNWSAITHIIIRAQASTGTPKFYVDDFKYFANTQKPFVACTFDDGLLSQFTNGKAKLDQYDIKGTFYVIHNELTPGTNMETSHHDILSSQGHDISGHGGTNLTTLTQAQRLTDLRSMKKYLTERGYRGSNNYALPNGAYNDAVLADVRDYFNSIANIDWLTNTPEYSPQYLINRFSPDSSTSTATIQAWIDNAILYGGCVVIAWHGIVASGATGAQVTQATYDTIMDYIGAKKAAGAIDTGTLTDYYARPIRDNPIYLPSVQDPTIVPKNGINIYSKEIAGRHLLKMLGPSGIDTVMQVGLHGNSIFMVAPASGTTAPTVWGGTLTTAATMSLQQTIASANPWLATSRKRFATAATAGSVSGMRTAYTQWFRGNAAGFGGFWFRAQLGHNINLNGSQYFFWLCASTGALATTAGAVAALVNMIGMGYDTTDANTGNWFFYRNDGTGTATKVDLGTNALRSNVSHGYDLIMYCPPGAATTIYVRIINIHTGAIVLDTSYTTDIPAVNVGLAFKAELNNGAVASAANLEVAKVYIESDY